MKKYFPNHLGFTLVELLVGVVIVGIIGTAILNLYIRSTRTYSAQLQVTEAQQNVRAGLDFLAYDVRMAGYDPASEIDATISVAGPSVITFTADLDDDGVLDADETISYGLGVDTNDVARLLRANQDIDPMNDAQKNAIDPAAAVAEYIDEIGLAYAFDSNGDGELDVDAGGRIHWAIVDPGGGGNWFELDANDDDLITIADDTDADDVINAVDTGIVADLEDIRAVKIWLLGRAPQIAQDYTNSATYVVGNRIVTANDNYRRRLLTTSVLCRNMGI